MTDFEHIPDRLRNLIDEYVSGQLDEPGVKELEAGLHQNREALLYFVRYARMHTDLHLELRSHRLSARVFEQIEAFALSNAAAGNGALPGYSQWRTPSRRL